MFKRLGIGKSLLVFVFVTSLIVLGMSSVFFYTSQKELSNIEKISSSATSGLSLQTSLLKTMSLVHSNILSLAAETDADSREIRLEIVGGYFSELKAIVAKCGNACSNLKEDFNKYETTWETIKTKLTANNLAEASAGIINDLNPLVEALFDKLDKAATEVSKKTEADILTGHKSAERTKLFLIILIGTLASGILLAGWIFQRRLVRAIENVVEKVQSSAQTTSTMISEVSDSTETLSGAATSQAASIEETVASLEEMSSMIKRNADHAKLAADLSAGSKNDASEGGRQIDQLITSMKDINTSSKKIEEIIEVIDDIAFQTNLLALNAAVEAARAGEQGRGFAVVADAVRSLAQRSAEAAKEVGSIISMSVDQVERGTKLADHSGVALNKIIESIQKVSELNLEISVASQEQSQGITQLSAAMSAIDQATQTNASVAENLSQSSLTLVTESTALEGYTKELDVLLKGAKKALKKGHS